MNVIGISAGKGDNIKAMDKWGLRGLIKQYAIVTSEVNTEFYPAEQVDVEIARLKKERKELLEMVMDMANQFMHDPTKRREPIITHIFMSTEEQCIDLLLRYRVLKPLKNERYELLWKALEGEKK